MEECGLTGSESSGRNLVHDMRAIQKETKIFVPLKFAPGEAVQINWEETIAYINGEKMVINLVCARLCHSYASYVIAYRRQNLESLVPSSILAAFSVVSSSTMSEWRSSVDSVPML